jgi:hypothetical protein
MRPDGGMRLFAVPFGGLLKAASKRNTAAGRKR